MNILHIDIETAPMLGYLWDLKTNYVPHKHIAKQGYVLCFAAKWEHEESMEFYSVKHDGREKMVEAAWGLLDKADAVVHYNGNKFDIPTLNTAFMQAGLGRPEPAVQIDLYRVVKKNFKLPSYSLEYVAKHLLGLDQGKVSNRGMDLWTDCMAGDETGWAEMEEYNRQDVNLLPLVYEKLRPWITTHPNMGLYKNPSAGTPTCPNCGGTHLIKRGIRPSGTGIYQRYKCGDCGTWTRSRYRENTANTNIVTQI